MPTNHQEIRNGQGMRMNAISPVLPDRVIDKLAWIHIVDRHLLSTRSRGKDTYYIPGGKRELGESDMTALCREIREELSIDLDQNQLVRVGVFEADAHDKPQGISVRMTCYSGPYRGTILAAAEIDEIAWLCHKDRERISAVDKIIFDYLKDRDLID